eukprot:CAMPEP_0198145532 /NCGR_PEP_ID=MMETSP1443-20131203/24191_1 /TAXON_ID=186043 /ORGANISM="Entomoneis sp., Strain CCMP2396" /LENGTH=219 /DNA_ID=CAMNT_0043809217 /DNA_START=71 /DNA_END=727 /DNA_ORIENTATION=+
MSRAVSPSSASLTFQDGSTLLMSWMTIFRKILSSSTTRTRTFDGRTPSAQVGASSSESALLFLDDNLLINGGFEKSDSAESDLFHDSPFFNRVLRKEEPRRGNLGLLSDSTFFSEFLPADIFDCSDLFLLDADSFIIRDVVLLPRSSIFSKLLSADLLEGSSVRLEFDSATDMLADASCSSPLFFFPSNDPSSSSCLLEQGDCTLLSFIETFSFLCCAS